MYAVISAGASQQKVAEGEQVEVDLLDAAEGDEVTLTATLLVDGDTVLATPDELSGVTVSGRVAITTNPKEDRYENERPARASRVREVVRQMTTGSRPCPDFRQPASLRSPERRLQ